MTKIIQNLLIFVLISVFLGCESKNTYDISSDKAVSDLNIRIQSLDEDLTTLKTELESVRKVLEDPDIEASLRASIRKEIHEGEIYVKEIEQWKSFLQVRRKQRYKSLVDRQGQKNLKEQAEGEVKEYFIDKKLNPIKNRWKDRYRTAIEL